MGFQSSLYMFPDIFCFAFLVYFVSVIDVVRRISKMKDLLADLVLIVYDVFMFVQIIFCDASHRQLN